MLIYLSVFDFLFNNNLKKRSRIWEGVERIHGKSWREKWEVEKLSEYILIKNKMKNIRIVNH